MPRFVILYHETPAGFSRPAHWDFMVEAGGALRTWALAEAPASGRATVAEPLPDHRLAYLDYEGPVSGQRGSVARWDAGAYDVLEETPERLVVRLRGERAAGIATLTAASGGAWRFVLDG